MIVLAPCRWLPDDTPALNRAFCERAKADDGLLEESPGSNRSPVIDSYCRALGIPLGSSWCAAALAAWCRDVGARVPDRDAGACEAWYAMGKARSTLTDQPRNGCIALYDFEGTKTANHCGGVIRIAPLVLSVEGNTTLKRQTGNEREGEGCAMGLVDHAHLLAYMLLEAA